MQCMESIGPEQPQQQPNGNSSCMWHRSDPTSLVFIVYAFIVPVLAGFGIFANFVNAIVFMRPKMSPSAFTYLAALSWLDCASCLIILFTAISRSLCYDMHFWLVYDYQLQVPLFGFTTGAANLVLACVSCDRLVYLRRWTPSGPPRFCKRYVARRLVVLVIMVAFLVNLPYFFVFVITDDNMVQVTPYYFSKHYKFHNWFTFILLTVLPAIFLLVGNAAIIMAFRRWTKQGKKCQSPCGDKLKDNKKRFRHQMKLTLTILIVITLYLVGELPAHLTSRKSALNLMFGGDVTKVDFEMMETLELICITLNALQLSLNIIIYALINPVFVPEFFLCLRGASDKCFKIFCFTAIANCYKRRFKRQKEPTCNGNAAGGTEPKLAVATVEELRKGSFELPMCLRQDQDESSGGDWWRKSSTDDDYDFFNFAFAWEAEESSWDEQSQQATVTHCTLGKRATLE